MEPGALPVHIILLNNHISLPDKFCTTYDIDEDLVTIYENFKAFRASKDLGRIKLLKNYTPFIDILHN
jgi:hypothetical protein